MVSQQRALANHINKICYFNSSYFKLSPIVEEVYGFGFIYYKKLELFHSLSSQGTHGTLIDCIDKTKTSGGGGFLEKR